MLKALQAPFFQTVVMLVLKIQAIFGTIKFLEEVCVTISQLYQLTSLKKMQCLESTAYSRLKS